MALESVRVPEVGESVTEGTIATWFAKPGSLINAGDPLFELATEKVDSEIPSPISGTVVEILIPTGGAVRVGDLVVTIETADSAAVPASMPPPKAPTAKTERVERPSSPPAGSTSGAPKAPAAATRPSEAPESSNGLPLPPMPPVTSAPKSSASLAPTPVSTSADMVEPGEGDTFIPFTRIRSVTSRIVSQSSATVPHALSMVEVDHASVMAARAAVKGRGNVTPPTALAFVAVAVARALGEHPVLNSSVGDGGLIFHRDINLAFAVDTEDGLLAPVVHHADQLTVTGMGEAINNLANRARTKRLAPDDMTGGTFAISNNGSVGSILTAPIITPPQVAVLSTDRVIDRAVVLSRDGTKSIAIRPVGNLAMSWDHRAMDGADAARFLSRVKEILESTDWGSVV